MGHRIYVASFDNVTISAIQDVLDLKAGAANGIEIHHIVLTAGGVSAPAEIRLRLKRGTATVTQGSGGSALTAAPIDDGDLKSATATVRANDTTQATTTGAFTVLTPWQWNVLMPFEHLPAPEDREVCQASEAFILDIPAAPTSTVVSGFIKWRELP